MKKQLVGELERRATARDIKGKAMTLLDISDLTDFLSFLGTEDSDGSASTAFRTVIAEKVTEYAMKAMREAKKRRTRLGAAAIIIAAERGKVDQ